MIGHPALTKVPSNKPIRFLVLVTAYNSELPSDSCCSFFLLIQLNRGLGAVVAVVPGAETGVKLSDHVQESLIRAHEGVLAGPSPVRTNGSSGSEARREKYEMGETVRSAGVRSVTDN